MSKEQVGGVQLHNTSLVTNDHSSKKTHKVSFSNHISFIVNRVIPFQDIQMWTLREDLP